MIFNIEVHKHFVDYRLAVTDNRAVYCIHDPSSKLTKIGFSTNAQRRLQEVKYGSRDFRKAYLLGAIYTGYYRQVEKDLHHVYSEKRVKGEWFSLSLDETKWIFDIFKPHREFVAGFILLYNRKHKWVCCPSNGVVFLAYSFWNTYIQGDATEFYRFTRKHNLALEIGIHQLYSTAYFCGFDNPPQNNGLYHIVNEIQSLSCEFAVQEGFMKSPVP